MHAMKILSTKCSNLQDENNKFLQSTSELSVLNGIKHPEGVIAIGFTFETNSCQTYQLRKQILFFEQERFRLVLCCKCAANKFAFND